ncbi:uncharacterized protein si:ch211-243a20.4 isoform X1 [Micropterus salmoides]|uniref:uncharacterized protein si:ch211-243a20.4 isoform X1 n=2 Tax=Micropterus salmoides TaxID=27706 RepID=UPI0018EB60B2|nr:uncharacterized protein si:ch211-243a20.4 isoform X1 [Micropterus salmoides]
MEAQRFWHLSFKSTWIFVFFFSSVCSGMPPLKIHLKSTVFVALTGEDLNIESSLDVPANQSGDMLRCFDPKNREIYSCEVRETAGQSQQLTLLLKNLSCSGEYHCQYKTANVYWFLLVRNEGYKDIVNLESTELITVAVFTGVLLVFSVVGSVCVFRGHWKEHITEDGKAGRKRKQNKEKKKERETEEDNVNVIPAQSTSFYASLEPRPRSIYDVLDHSAANRKSESDKSKPKKMDPQKTMGETTQPKEEGVFESVYENF